MSGGNFCYTSGVLIALAADIEETFKKYEEDWEHTIVPLAVEKVVRQLNELEPLVRNLDKLIGGDIGIDTCIAGLKQQTTEKTNAHFSLDSCKFCNYTLCI